MVNEKDRVSNADPVQRAGSKFTGRVIQLTQFDFEDGGSLISPAGDANVGVSSLSVTVGDIISIACKIFPSLCGTTSGGGGGGCYVITGPDGTKITICPPPVKSVAA